MSSRSRSGRIRHRPRDVSTRRPMHLTAKLLPGLPSLRRRGALAEFRRLRGRAPAAGTHPLLSRPPDPATWHRSSVVRGIRPSLKESKNRAGSSLVSCDARTAGLAVGPGPVRHRH